MTFAFRASIVAFSICALLLVIPAFAADEIKSKAEELLAKNLEVPVEEKK